MAAPAPATVGTLPYDRNAVQFWVNVASERHRILPDVPRHLRRILADLVKTCLDGFIAECAKNHADVRTLVLHLERLLLIPHVVLTVGENTQDHSREVVFQRGQAFIASNNPQQAAFQGQVGQPPPARDPDEWAIKQSQFEAYVCGNATKAIRLLGSNGLHAVNRDTLDKLEELHPKQSGLDWNAADFPVHAGNAACPNLSVRDVRRVLHSSDKAGAAAGLDGWRPKHLLSLFEGIGATLKIPDKLAKFCSILASHRLPNEVLSLLSAAVLVPLRKPNDGVRPIAIGLLFCKITEKCLLAKVQQAKAVGPRNVGVGVKDGVIARHSLFIQILLLSILSFSHSISIILPCARWSRHHCPSSRNTAPHAARCRSHA